MASSQGFLRSAEHSQQGSTLAVQLAKTLCAAKCSSKQRHSPGRSPSGPLCPHVHTANEHKLQVGTHLSEQR